MSPSSSSESSCRHLMIMFLCFLSLSFSRSLSTGLAHVNYHCRTSGSSIHSLHRQHHKPRSSLRKPVAKVWAVVVVVDSSVDCQQQHCRYSNIPPVEAAPVLATGAAVASSYSSSSRLLRISIRSAVHRRTSRTQRHHQAQLDQQHRQRNNCRVSQK